MPFFTGDLSGLLVRLHDENLRVTRQQSRRRRMYVELAKTAAERLVLIDSQLLIAKEEHQVVHERTVDLLKLPIVERLGQIETKDLGASARCRFPYLYSRMSHAFGPCGRRTQIVRNVVCRSIGIWWGNSLRPESGPNLSEAQSLIINKVLSIS